MSQGFQNKAKTKVFDENTLPHFVSFLNKRARQCDEWAQQNGISCYRIYDADVDPYALAIDVFKGAAGFEGQTYLVISEYRPSDTFENAKTARLFAEAVGAAANELGVPRERVFEKTRHHDRSGSQYKDGQRDSHVIHVRESEHLFELDLAGYLDTGIFLDHRPTRERIGRKAKEKHFLNLFAYTGTATVYAAAAGAATTTTIDLSQTYLKWAKRNMELNGLEGEQHRFIRSDAMHWLDRDIRKGVTYDLVFVDPPTFSNSKLKGKKTWSVARDYEALLEKVVSVLSPQGQAIFSCNLRDFKPDFLALEHVGVRLMDVTKQSIPFDFAQNPQIHQCYLVEQISRKSS